MAINFTEYFTPRAIAAYWDEAYSNRMEYLGDAFFGTKRKAGLDLKWIRGSKGVPVTLMPSTFDAKAKFRDRIGFKAIETEMPFFREGYLLKEKDRQEIMRATDSNDPYAREIINRVFDDVSDLVEGAHIVGERMIWQLLAPTTGAPGIAIVANGVDYTYNYDADGKWQANNYTALSGTSQWNDAANADPLTDMMTIMAKARANTGVALTTAIMNTKTFNHLLKSEAVRAYVLAQNPAANVLLTPAVVKNAISGILGLDVVVYDKAYRDDAGEVKSFYPDGMVTFVPDGELGSLYKGTTPEEADLMGGSEAEVSIVDNGTAITRIVNPHPVNIEIYASEIVLPSFERMDDVYALKVVAD